MKQAGVKIADFKAHLSHYVRAAQRGEEILIRDRQTPVARLLPVREPSTAMRVMPAAKPVAGTSEMAAVRLARLKARDVQKVLAGMRDDRAEAWLSSLKSTSTRR